MSAVELEDVKTHLNLKSGVDDAELQGFIDAAEAVIARRVGPLEPTTISRRILSNGYSLVLPIVPVLSITSISPVYAAAVSIPGLYLDSASGVLTSLDGRSTYFTTDALYDVTYVAGRAPGAVTEDLLLAVKEMVRHLWRSQRGGGTRPGSAADPNAAAPGYLIPNAVAELIAPDSVEFGFA